MQIESLAAALERDHRDIDDGLEVFAAETTPTEHGRQALMRAIRALRRHIYLEEEYLFPPLHAAGMMAPVFVMLREHAQIWVTLDALERELAAGSSGHLLCHQLAVQLQHHNLKEEKILYPQVDVVVPESAVERLRAFLASGELPEGWVCHRYNPPPAPE
jgi:regulator of cell morphogenesis and NO signaling